MTDTPDGRIPDDVSGEQFAALQDSSARYELLAQYITDVIWVMNLDLRFTYLSPSVERALGYTPDELVGLPLSKIMPTEAAEMSWSVLAEELTREAVNPADPNRSRTLELELSTRDGGSIWCEVRVSFVRGAHGAPTGIAGVARDITARKAAEEALRESEERLTLALDAANEGLWDWSVPTGETYLSPRFFTMLGYDPDELPQSYSTWVELLHPEDRARAVAYAEERAAAGEGYHNLQFRLRTKSGGYKWILARGKVVERDADGRVVRMVGTHVDVDDLRTAESSLQQSRATAWAMLNATYDMAMFVDREWVIEGANEAFARRFGGDSGEVVSECGLDLMPPEFVADRRKRMAEVLATGQPQRFESQTGGIHFASSMYPVADNDGYVHHVAVFIQDVTEHKRAEEEDRLAALGQLSAGVAHEFNNVLAGIMLLAERAEQARTQDDFVDLGQRIHALAERGSAIAGSLTAFAAAEEPSRQPVVIEDIIDSALAVVTSELLTAGIMIERDSGGERARVEGNASQLSRMLVNLILNSCRAMPEGGTLTLSTRVEKAASGSELVTTLSDTGHGIPAEDLQHVFEPFFRTQNRPPGERVSGAGLGLSVVHGIVTNHGGSISVSSDPGGGASFEIRLPALVEDEEAQADTTSAPDSHAEAGLRILLAEDEPDIGGMAAEVLERQGHNVTYVSTGADAIGELSRNSFDLVITDMLMPEGSGLDVLTTARASESSARLMVITGHIGDSIAQELAAYGVNTYLRKPFGMVQFLRAVEEALANGS